MHAARKGKKYATLGWMAWPSETLQIGSQCKCSWSVDLLQKPMAKRELTIRILLRINKP